MNALKPLFTNKKYWILFVVISVATLLALVWLGNLPTITSFFSLPISIDKKIIFLFALITTLGVQNTVLSFITTIILVLLFASNITLIVFYIHRHRTGTSTLSFGKGIAGFIAGMFGIGCSACGVALLGPLFAVLGIGTFIRVLPLHGQEFALIGIILLLLSIWSLVRHMNKPMVCEIE